MGGNILQFQYESVVSLAMFSLLVIGQVVFRVFEMDNYCKELTVSLCLCYVITYHD